MKEQRSRSQVYFSLLPEQTVDLRRRVWKVDTWIEALALDVDRRRIFANLRSELARWGGRDGGLTEAMNRGLPVEIRQLNKDRGVRVTPFPKVFECRRCHTIGRDPERPCTHCSGRSWGQLPFVGYHGCGRVFEPLIPHCEQHKLSRIRTPGTTRAGDITFDCPKCGMKLGQRSGLGVRRCDCGRGTILYNVHRAGIVYSPCSFAMVNPASPEQIRELEGRGGPPAALQSWAIGDRTDPRQPEEELRARLAGLPPEMIEDIVSQQIAAETVRPARQSSGEFRFDQAPVQALREALDLTIAGMHGRSTMADLLAGSPNENTRARIEVEYAAAVERAGLEGVELFDQFPVLRVVYGYTRGPEQQADLTPFRRGASYQLLADQGTTEALLFKLDPIRLVRWLASQHPEVTVQTTIEDARLELLRTCSPPAFGSDVSSAAGMSLLTLVHSMSHRVVRQGSVLAGIDREALAEYLLPSLGGFFVYAQPRGEFVLGGLQAVFETELHRLLDAVVLGESRCPLDPACLHKGGAACPACLHLGEPSCRYFNRYLSRSSMFGRGGYLRLPTSP